jgi:putative PIN family toxin of toxin-antitoxin system
MIAVVLDTNVLLDLWVFDDAAAQALRDALDQRRCEALASAQTDAELTDVLARPHIAVEPTRRQDLLARWRATTRSVARVFPAPWHCSDPKDQPFLDLAFTARADWLLTRDKALLKLARRARRDGLRIGLPADFTASI